MISDVEMYAEIIAVVQRQVEFGVCLQGLVRLMEKQEKKLVYVEKMALLNSQGGLVLSRDMGVLQKQLQTLQGVVGSLQQDIATLEEKFSLMEKVLNVEVLPHMHEPCEDDVDEGGAERAEMEWLGRHEL